MTAGSQRLLQKIANRKTHLIQRKQSALFSMTDLLTFQYGCVSYRLTQNVQEA